MEGLLGCWRSFFEPLSLDPELSKQAQYLCKSLSAKGVTVNEDMLKVLFVVFCSLLVASASDILYLYHGWRQKQLEKVQTKHRPLNFVIYVSGCAVCLSCTVSSRSQNICSRSFFTVGHGV